jgi:hypothetical protein
MKRQLRTWVSAVCVVGLATLGAPLAAMGAVVPAGAGSQVACGDVLTSDVTLNADLVCTGEVGLRVQGDLTINLNKHRLAGPGSGTGVRLEGTESAVTLVNGTISGWGVGVAGDPNEVQRMVVREALFMGNGTGVWGAFNKTADIERSRFEANDTGVAVDFSSHAAIDRSVFTDNHTAASASNSGLLISHSKITSNQVGVECTEAGCDVVASLLRDNGKAMWGLASSGNVSGSLFQGNDAGAALVMTMTVFEHNVFRDNTQAIYSSLDDSLIRRNRFLGNGTAFRGDGSLRSGGTLEDNTITGNVDGIYWTEGLGGPGLSLQGNVAVHNSGYGIYAPGSTDMGGNIAHHNGNEPQCTGVIC